MLGSDCKTLMVLDLRSYSGCASHPRASVLSFGVYSGY